MFKCNMQIDKKNNGVNYNDEFHTYWDENDNGKYISVTTLIHSFAQDFNKEFWSAYKALEKLLPKDKWLVEKRSLLNTKRFDKSILSLYDINENDFNREQQKILDDWEKENKAACDRGTKIHADLENSFYDAGDNVSLKKFSIGGKFTCKKDYTNLDLENGVYPEYLISKKTKDGILRLAGQIDLIVKSGNDIYIIDHKTNKKIDLKSGYDSITHSSARMKYPLNNLDDCNFNHYQLQLSTYAWMLQQVNPEFKIKGLILNHYDHQGNNTLYNCEYLKNDVERMLAYYKKELIKQAQKERRKPIEY